MKKFWLAAAVLFGCAAATQAQTVDKIEDKIEAGARKAANKTAEVASKGKAKVTDEVYKDKTGPDGETVYIDNHARYYWIDKQGKRHYTAETELKPKDE
jgi:uncharacterized protein YcfL